MKIVSGGQTGVDRAALDAALETHMPAGGWCPAGRTAEDGVIPDIYPVVELTNAGYRARTRKNVIDSDATLIVYFKRLSGGTKETHGFCLTERKPYLLINAEETPTESALEELLSFIEHHKISTLNVAGPRASGDARAYGYTKQLILTALNALKPK
ncbi:MAG: putative molybdenum carrier protein [Candidatus Thiodiazotropha sp. (ex Myrtea sp. 'scaly one' KF741663)]|nr:putative molybdenum carrier protein [Candidatus Thiodiazotropha sp. (ex Myrtea sp. 'scaly one' KF741663)]